MRFSAADRRDAPRLPAAALGSPSAPGRTAAYLGRYLGIGAAEVPRHLGIAAQFALLMLAVQQFQLVSMRFFHFIVPLTLVGFVVHGVLARRLRMGFFVGLSFVGLGVMFQSMAALWIIAGGLGLIGICHLPIRYGARVGLLLLAACGLGVARVGLPETALPGNVWPIFGAMFMFRLMVYAYDVKHGKSGTLTERLAYFFMLPNVAFALFPVVDYATFRRTYYDQDAHEIHQRGVRVFLRGVIHLLLFRAVNYYMMIAPESVADPADLVRLMVANYLLYLRVSGYFHLIVGMLHLFGFNLPRTHNKYFLATGFTDFWRRINIYWKDFMQKLFFYPAYFKLRKTHPRSALALSLLVVFAATWALHSVQWFWIRGEFLLAWQDVAFWTILAGLVVWTAHAEEKKRGRKTLGKPPTNWKTRGVTALKTVRTFSIMCVLWSLWTSASIADWFTMLRNAWAGA